MKIAGIDVMLQNNSSIQIITGCEFSGHYKGKDIHILGYGLIIMMKDYGNSLNFLKKNVNQE